MANRRKVFFAITKTVVLHCVLQAAGTDLREMEGEGKQIREGGTRMGGGSYRILKLRGERKKGVFENGENPLFTTFLISPCFTLIK